MKIAVIGCGAMGTAFARKWAQLKQELILCDRNPEKGEALAKQLRAKYERQPSKAVKGADCVLLAVKPEHLNTASKEIGSLGKEQVLLSILSGVTVQDLKTAFKGGEIARLMPNLAVKQGKSVLSLAPESLLSSKGRKRLEQALSGLGTLFEIPEKKMDAVAALAGSGPAFVLAFIEAFVEGGIYMGFSAKDALELTIQTLESTLALLRDGAESPQTLRWQICSPGGTTIEGIRALEKGGMRASIIEALKATWQKASGPVA